MVYVVKAGDYIKVGYTKKNLKARIAGLQTGNPQKVELLRVFDGGRDLEKLFHKALDDYRIRGEWFDASVEAVWYLLCIAPPHVIGDGTRDGWVIGGKVCPQKEAKSIWMEIEMSSCYETGSFFDREYGRKFLSGIQRELEKIMGDGEDGPERGAAWQWEGLLRVQRKLSGVGWDDRHKRLEAWLDRNNQPIG